MRKWEVRDLQLDELRAAALDACIVPVIVYTDEVEFVYVNPAGRKLFALGDGDDVGINGLDLVAERSRGESALDELFSNGTWRGAIRGRSLDGRLLDLIVSSRLVRQGDDGYIVCSVIDSTELVETRAEAESRQSELEAILSHLDEVVYRNWCRTDLCPQHESFVSRSVENLVGHTAGELQETRDLWLGLVHPEDRGELRSALETVAGNRSASVQYRVRKGDDEGYRWVEDHVIPQTDEAGNLVGAIGALRDVTARKAAEVERVRLEDQLRRASREWGETFDAIQQPVLILGSRGHVLRLNRATLVALGIERFEQVLGRELWQCSDGEPWVTVQRMVAQLQVGEQVESRKVVDGVRSWLVSVSPVPDRESETEHGTVVYLRHMTEIDRLEASLRQAERMAELGSLVAGVAHEVRNPLFGISAIVDALKSGAIPDDELPESLDLLHNEVDRLNRLASGLLEFGKPVPAPQDRHAVSSLVEEVMRECSATAREKRVVFLFSGLSELPAVSVDRRSFLTALRNLVENAIQHAPEESEIRLQGRRLDGDHVELEVRDHGPGFPEEERERYLQPFFSRRPGGTGLGLSIAANVVRQHGGRLTLGNADDGGGRVLVALPLERPQVVAEVGA